MGQRFPEAAEQNAGEIGQPVQAFLQSSKCIHRHLGFSSIPDIADARAAVQVAACSRLDIDFP